MSDVTLSYKGSDILELSDSGSATLKTGGTYCEADIEVEYVKPSGGGGIDFIDVDEGEFTVTSDGLTTLTINHNLGVVPFCCMVIPVTDKSDGRHVVGGITLYINKDVFHVPLGTNIIRPNSNYVTYGKFGFYTEAAQSSLTAGTEITQPSVGNYVKNFTSTSFDLTSSSSYPIMSGITYRWRALAFNSNL